MERTNLNKFNVLPQKENFYKYLNKKYFKINQKIKKNKNRLNRKILLGGAPDSSIAKIQLNLAQLEVLKNIIEKKISTGDKINFDAISEPIEKLVKNLQEFASDMNKKMDVADTANIAAILNEVTTVESLLATNKEDYLNIRLKTKPTIVYPPINIPPFEQSYQKILEEIDKQIKELFLNIKQIDNKNEEAIKKNLQVLKENIDFITNKINELDSLIVDINSRIKEMDDYTKFELSETDIQPKFFFTSEENELITMEKLEGLSYPESDEKTIIGINESIQKLYSENVITPNLLVKPEFQKDDIFSGGASNNNVLIYSKDDMQEIIEALFNKWKESLNKIKQKISDDNEQDKILKTNDLESRLKLEDLNLLKNNIEKLNNLIDKINKYNSNIKIFNCLNNSKLKSKIIELMHVTETINEFCISLDQKIAKIKKQSEIETKQYNKLVDEINNLNNTIDKHLFETDELLTNENALPDKFIKECDKLRISYIEKEIDTIVILLSSIKSLILKPSTKLTSQGYYPEKLKFIITTLESLNNSEQLKKIKDIKTKNNVDNAIKKLDEYRKIQNFNQFKLQTGGSIKEWENYYFKIIDLFKKINDYKKKYDNFNKVAKKFNMKYIQLYYHQLYISNYIALILLRDRYQLFEYLSKGSANYYRGIAQSIFEKCNSTHIRENNKVVEYFYKHHYVNLELVYNFLTELKEKWSVDRDFDSLNSTPKEIARNKNISRLKVITDDALEHSEQMKKGLFMFNIFKDILDNYQYTYASPIGVYLRINDYSGNVGTQNLPAVFSQDETIPEKLSINKLNMCDKTNEDIIKATSKFELDNLDKTIEKIDQIHFNEIYNSLEFEDNSTLAKYMNIPTYLEKGKSIMMMTYGYSGVGKTFTLFGKVGPPKQEGILQTSLLSIKNKKHMFMRTYEIYGKALPYKSYWTKVKKFDHQIFTYKLKSEDDMDIEVTMIDEEANMKTYLDQVKLNSSDGYEEINSQQIKNFEKFIINVDDMRIKGGRIKKTINNPVSSRSIMVYEFKIEIDIDSTKKFVRFIVMDLPGKEDIKSAYVYPNKRPDELKDEFCIKLKDNILIDTYIENGNKKEFKYNENAVRAAIFLNPLFICIFPTIASQIIEHFEETYQNEITDIVSLKRDNNDSIKTLRNYSSLTSIGSSVERYPDNENKKASTEMSDKFYVCLKASEIMRHLLENNKLSEIINFYNEKLLDISNECKDINSAGLPFEGFYINENILGLINQLRKRLNNKFEIPSDLMMNNFFSENMGKLIVYSNDNKTNIENIYENESVAQTYFIRNFLRKKFSNVHLIDDTGKHLLSDDNGNIDTQYSPSLKGETKSIKSWLEDSYDFNKVYSKTPPIATFLKAYFEKEEASTSSKESANVIDNFYLFFVVNNETIGKCANQIKLIADSKDFIKSIRDHGVKQVSSS
jgi:hypothetical protein